MALSYFAEYSGSEAELWVTDGTSQGTHLVQSVGIGSISNIKTVGSRVFFTFDDSIHGNNLWTSDGSAAGTVLVDIAPGGGNSAPSDLTYVGGELYFAANDGTNGSELWKSDGTAAGTVMVADIDPGSGGSAPANITAIGGEVYFTATDGVNGEELWKSDGTTSGTALVRDINPGATGSFPSDLTKINGALFFSAYDGVDGVELWKSDGTSSGTALFKDLTPGTVPSFPTNLTSIGARFYFTSLYGGSGPVLWESDGTPSGTVLMDLYKSSLIFEAPANLTNVNGVLFFSANDGIHGDELWEVLSSNPTGVHLVDDIDPGSASSSPSNLLDVNGELYFTADNGTSGVELWKSDGTVVGTAMVKDIDPGAASSSPMDLTAVNGGVEFYAFDGAGEGLFSSDGTAAGTIEIATNIQNATPLGVTSTASDDLDGNSVSNVLLRNASGSFADWTMSGPAVTASTLLTSGGNAVTLSSAWSVDGVADLNGDGEADVLLRNSNGTFVDWTMNGSQIASSQAITAQGATVTLGSDWSVAGLGDFNGDGDADMLLHNANGTFADWTMNGSQVTSSQAITSQGAPLTLGSAWSVAGIGDFDGDGKANVLLHNSNGTFADWTMNGSQIASSQTITSQDATLTLSSAWSVAGIGDFNGDGLADVLLRNSSGTFADWTMNGSQVESAKLLTRNGSPVTLDPSWSIAALGDFNGDGKSDILLRNTSGAFAEWTMNGSAITAVAGVTAGGQAVTAPAWQVQGSPADLPIA
jgi:ELWxxDGT repeat protein